MPKPWARRGSLLRKGIQPLASSLWSLSVCLEITHASLITQCQSHRRDSQLMTVMQVMVMVVNGNSAGEVKCLPSHYFFLLSLSFIHFFITFLLFFKQPNVFQLVNNWTLVQTFNGILFRKRNEFCNTYKYSAWKRHKWLHTTWFYLYNILEVKL